MNSMLEGILITLFFIFMVGSIGMVGYISGKDTVYDQCETYEKISINGKWHSCKFEEMVE